MLNLRNRMLGGKKIMGCFDNFLVISNAILVLEYNTGSIILHKTMWSQSLGNGGFIKYQQVSYLQILKPLIHQWVLGCP